MNKTFKKSDIVDQQKMQKDIDATFDRLMEHPEINLGGRTPEQMYKDTEMGLVLEYYMMQNDPKFKKAFDLNTKDVYHDLIDINTNEIHECKSTGDPKGWESPTIKNRINKILRSKWNHSKYMHVATYDKKTEVYTYQGIKQIR